MGGAAAAATGGTAATGGIPAPYRVWGYAELSGLFWVWDRCRSNASAAVSESSHLNIFRYTCS